jgi:hypothetical protein
MRCAVALILILLTSAVAIDVLELTITEPPPGCPMDIVEAEATFRNLIDDNVMFTVKVSGDAGKYATDETFPINLGAFKQAKNAVSFRIADGTPAGSYEFTLTGSMGVEGRESSESSMLTVKDCGQGTTGPTGDGGDEDGSNAMMVAGGLAVLFVLAAAVLTLRASRAHAAVAAQPPAYAAYGQTQGMYGQGQQQQQYQTQPHYGPEASRCYYYDRVNFGSYNQAMNR